MTNIKKLIVIASALAVVGIFLGSEIMDQFKIPMAESLFVKETPETVRDRAWGTFEQYLAYARAQNIEGVKSLSHQVSPACADEARKNECLELLDSIVFFTTGLEKEKFTHTAYDSRQIVLWTDYNDTIKSILYFTRTKSGEPRLLGLRYCTEGESKQAECIDDNVVTEDENNNGWWDEVEVLFKK